MFVKRNDGLERSFLPFHISALILALLLTALGSTRGAAMILVFIGWYIAGFAASIALFYIAVLLYSLTIDMSDPPKEDHPRVRKVVVFIIGNLCRFGRLRLHLTGEDQLPDGRFLIVSNHRSNYDPIATVWALRRHDIGFITKPENLRIPLAGPMIFRANYLPINREDPREAIKTIRAATDLIKNDVVSIGVYPEGTRSRTGEMLPFHNGVFKIAQKSTAPIVVMSIQNTESITHSFPLHHTDVYLDILAVIPADEASAMTTAEIGGRVRTLLENSLRSS